VGPITSPSTLCLRGQNPRTAAGAGRARGVDMQAYLKAWLAQVKVPAAVRVSVDIDPVSFFLNHFPPMSWPGNPGHPGDPGKDFNWVARTRRTHDK